MVRSSEGATSWSTSAVAITAIPGERLGEAVQAYGSSMAYVTAVIADHASPVSASRWCAYDPMTPIITATADYIHLSSGGACVYEWVPSGKGGSFVISGRNLLSLPCRVAYVADLVASQINSVIGNIRNLSSSATSYVLNAVRPVPLDTAGQGGQSELYFRIAAGRPCQIALGTATKKRIQSVSPKLPAALGVSADGYYITGTPVVTGVHALTVTADDGSQLALTIEVLPAGFVVR